MSAKASFDGHLHPATVVEIQRGGGRKRNDQQQEEGEIEKYYIHYDKFDKRLDEWVSAENVHDYTAAGDGLFDESEAQNGGGGGGANKMNGRERFGYKHYQQRIHAAFRDESIIIVKQQKLDRRRPLGN